MNTYPESYLTKYASIQRKNRPGKGAFGAKKKTSKVEYLFLAMRGFSCNHGAFGLDSPD
jgi:hypothetical protein